VWKRKAEQYLADSGLPYTIIRLCTIQRVVKAIFVNVCVSINLSFFLAGLEVYKTKMVACES
jgi:hypothetical protein